MHDVQRAYDDPFVILHNDDLMHLMKHVKPTTVNVFLALHMRANRKEGMRCFPSLNTIAKDANVSRQTVVNAIGELKEHGLLTSESRMDEHGDPTSNMYWLHRYTSPESRGGSQEFRPGVVKNLDGGVVQNLDPNHMNPLNADEGEQYLSAREEIEQRLAQSFEAFYRRYPRKEGKADAQKAWPKALRLCGDLDTMLDALQQQIDNNWRGREKKFIPLPASWLRGQRWTDEITAPETSAPTTQKGMKASDLVAWANELEAQGL